MSSNPIRALVVGAILLAPTARGGAQEPVTMASESGRLAGQILAGGAGSLAGTFALAMIGSRLEGDDCNCDDPGLMGAIFGGLAGATIGAAIPVYLVGK